MSQKPRKGGRARDSQPSSSRHSRPFQEEEPMEEQLTQGSQLSKQALRLAEKTRDSMDSRMFDKKVAEMVRYLLCVEGKKAPVKRKDLNEKVLGEYSKAFPLVFEKANEQLQQVFGLEAKEIIRGKSKSYILINMLPSVATESFVKCPKQESRQKGLLCIILSLIMMKQGTITEDQMWNCLQRLGMSADSPHPVFGDVHKVISKEFVDQMYLTSERQAAGETHIVRYQWGPRAEAEVDKKEILSFVAEIYGGDLSQWQRQFSHVLDTAHPLQGVQD